MALACIVRSITEARSRNDGDISRDFRGGNDGRARPITICTGTGLNATNPKLNPSRFCKLTSPVYHSQDMVFPIVLRRGAVQIEEVKPMTIHISIGLLVFGALTLPLTAQTTNGECARMLDEIVERLNALESRLKKLEGLDYTKVAWASSY